MSALWNAIFGGEESTPNEDTTADDQYDDDEQNDDEYDDYDEEEDDDDDDDDDGGEYEQEDDDDENDDDVVEEDDDDDVVEKDDDNDDDQDIIATFVGKRKRTNSRANTGTKRHRRAEESDDDDDDDDDDDVDDRFVLPDDMMDEQSQGAGRDDDEAAASAAKSMQKNHVVAPVFNQTQELPDIENVFGSTGNVWKIIYEYESSTKSGGPRRLQYLSFENAAKVYCPDFNIKHYSKDWIARMRTQFFHICTEFYKTYFDTKYYKKEKYANGPHRVKEYTDTFKGVADKRKFLRPIAVYAATVALNEVNMDIMREMENSHRELFRYNQDCMSICQDNSKMSRASS